MDYNIAIPSHSHQFILNPIPVMANIYFQFRSRYQKFISMLASIRSVYGIILL